MKITIFSLLSCLFWISCSLATKLYRLEGRIVNSELFPAIVPIEQDIKVFLDHGQYIGQVQRSGKFIIHNVPAGNFSLSVASSQFQFPKARIDVGYMVEGMKGKIHAYSSRLGSAFDVKGPAIPYPLRLSPINQPIYLTTRDSFDLMGLLSSPMMLMSLVSLVLVLVAPKMLSNLDEETLKDVQDTQSAMTGAFSKFNTQKAKAAPERLADY